MTRSPTRLAIVVTHPIQYYSPWFRWMQAHSDLCIRVFYLSDTGVKPTHDEKFGTTFAWDVDLTSGYDSVFIPNESPAPDTLRYEGIWNPQLFPALRSWRPDAILVFGYRYRTHLRLIAWARWKRIPLLFRGDSHLIGREALPALSRWALRTLYGQFSAVTYVGHANRDYFKAGAVPDRKLFFAPHAVDSGLFTPRDDHRAQADRLRQELHLPDGRPVVLYAGKLIPSKQPRALLEAFLASTEPSVLVFCGDGPEKPDLLEQARGHEERVRFLPFANQSEMPARYLLARLLVLPSLGFYETWGLCVNEAMQMGVPCLVSDHVGCQRDLVLDGKTGWVFPADDRVALARRLNDALRDLRTDGERIRGNVAEQIRPYSYEQATAGLRAALAYALR